MKLVRKLFYLVVLVSLGGTYSVAGELTAKEVVFKAFKHLSSLDHYAFDAVIYDEYIVSEGDEESYRHTVSAKVDRPGNVRVDIKGDRKNRTLYLNDGEFTMVDHNHGYYGQLETPQKVDAALDFIIKKYGIRAPLTSLLYSDMPKRTKFTKSKNFGEKDVAGVLCDYVAFKNSGKEIHVWIAKGDKPLVKAYSVIETTKQATYRTDTSITWKTDASMKANDFVFTASKGVTKISIESAN